MDDHNKKVGMVSLGCPKALVDSENILGELQSGGYSLVGDYEQADLVIVNTCGFIDSAKSESLDTIAEAMKENGRVIVTGCMGKGSDAQRIMASHPEVLSISGPADTTSVINAVQQHLPISEAQQKIVQQSARHLHTLPGLTSVKLTPAHYAYVKISEGCNHRCSFCIIPSMRGDLVSRPIDDVYREAEHLVDKGVKELLIVSQDTSAYGVDTRYKLGFIGGKAYETRMVSLADALGELGVWVRLHYVYPYPHVDKVIPLMAEGKILPYLDIPFQHASPAILKAMKRPGNIENLTDRISHWRSICPDLTIRSTFIVGFPGETEEDFELLLNWLEEAQLDRVGCFQYSPVDGAIANQLGNPVEEAIKEDRWRRFMEVQQRISCAKLQAKIGTVEPVIIDGVDEERDCLIGRTRGDAPEIDGQVFIDAEGDFGLGDIISVKVTSADDYDLFAIHNAT